MVFYRRIGVFERTVLYESTNFYLSKYLTENIFHDMSLRHSNNQNNNKELKIHRG